MDQASILLRRTPTSSSSVSCSRTWRVCSSVSVRLRSSSSWKSRSICFDPTLYSSISDSNRARRSVRVSLNRDESIELRADGGLEPLEVEVLRLRRLKARRERLQVDPGQVDRRRALPLARRRRAFDRAVEDLADAAEDVVEERDGCAVLDRLLEVVDADVVAEDLARALLALRGVSVNATKSALGSAPRMFVAS